MNNLTLFRFHFTSPLHIGTTRADYALSGRRFHSDSLYSAILSAWNLMGVEHPALMEAGDKELLCPELGFTITSLFPFYQKNDACESIYFFPKPLDVLGIPDDPNLQKKAKKIEYLDLQEYLKLLNGGKIDCAAEEEKIKGRFFSGQHFDPAFMDSEVYPRVRVPRGGGEDSEVYYIDRMFFKDHAGLFCIAKFDDSETGAKVKAALKFLESEGIGTDRRVGNGQFEVSWMPFYDFDALAPSAFATNLSLFCPESKDQLSVYLGEKARYELVKRGGWMTTEPYLTFRKGSVYMFREGGIFHLDHPEAGKVVNLQPNVPFKPVEHPVWRVGKSLFLPVQLING